MSQIFVPGQCFRLHNITYVLAMISGKNHAARFLESRRSLEDLCKNIRLTVVYNFTSHHALLKLSTRFLDNTASYEFLSAMYLDNCIINCLSTVSIKQYCFKRLCVRTELNFYICKFLILIGLVSTYMHIFFPLLFFKILLSMLCYFLFTFKISFI